MTHELIVADLFCGGGGASEGLIQAAKERGVKIKHYAVNHWKTAIDTFKANHPEAIVKRAPVSHVNPITFVKEGYLDILIAAPECIFHSAARGGKPIDDQRRSTAWGVVDWAERLRPKQILIENVVEYKKWGPLHHCESNKLVTKVVNGKKRKVASCKKHGKLCLHNKPIKERKGEIYEQYLNAFRTLGYKIEQRELVAANFGGATTRKRLFIIMTLGDEILWPEQTHNEDGSNGLQKWREAREVIDWTLEGQSIFERKRPLAPATIRRIMAGLERHGGEALRPFLVVMRRHMEGKSLDAPVPTIAANGTHLGLAEPVILRTTHGSDTSKRERSVKQPLPTVTGANRGELAIAQPFVLSQASGGAPRPVDEPMPTICTDGAHQLVDAVLVEYHSEKRETDNRARSLNDPLPTQTTENRFGIAEPILINTSHGQRVHDVARPMPTLTTAKGGHMAVAAPFIVPPRHMNEGAVDSVNRPVRTITAAAGRNFGLVNGTLVPFYSERPGQDPRAHSLDEPVPVIPATGDGKFGLAQPFIASYYGTLNVSPVDEPVPTVTTKGRFGLVQPIINGYMLDIKFRMLQPHELAAAMDFPKNYKFKGKTKGDAIKMIGNAWDVQQGKVLCAALLINHQRQWQRAA